jgi:hypothetical protein
MSRLQHALEKSIVSYLEAQGIEYEKKSGNNYYYFSPFKSENNPSFCVNVSGEKEFFKDFSTGEKAGDIIDLVCKLNRVSTSEAISIILDGEEWDINPRVKKTSKPQIMLSAPKPLEHHFLLDYIVGVRKIKQEIAQKYCRQIWVEFPSSKSSRRKHLCLAFANRSGGYELRNPYLKVSSSPKMITRVDDFYAKSSLITQIFEGFLDFLSYLCHNGWDTPKYRTIILNGLCNMPYVDFNPNGIYHMYLDNDYSATRELQKLTIKYEDKRYIFEGYKDYNAAWIDSFARTNSLRDSGEKIRRFLLGQKRGS